MIFLSVIYIISVSTDETQTPMFLCRFFLPALEGFALKLQSLVSIWYRYVGMTFLISDLPCVFLLNS